MATPTSRISPTGTISRRVAYRKMQHRKVTARLLGEAFMDITDGDNDNRKAAAILMRLQELNLYEHDVEARQYDGDLAGAEESAMRYLLAEDGKAKK